MTDLRLDPADDGLSELFGLPGGGADEVTSPPSSPLASSQPAFPTRRELRAAREVASVAPGRSRARATRRDARAGSRRTVPVQPEIAAYVPTRSAEQRSPRKPMRVVVVLVVAGLFGSAGLPAYALGVNGELNPEAAQASLDVRSVEVSADSAIEPESRGSFGATSPADLAKQRSDTTRQANYEAYLKSGAREQGDDYPYFSELSDNQGGGLSPLNYFYRECVDFVAWRLNRDVGSTSAPYTFVWSYLTPNGGDASQWRYNWEAHGWPTSTTPKVGWVAWFAGNHVAYVAAVNPDGTVLIEEYNHGSMHTYGKRVIPVTDVALFLSPPPLPESKKND